MKKLLLVFTTVALVIVMAFGVSAKSQVKSVKVKGVKKNITLTVGDKRTYTVKVKASKKNRAFKVKSSKKKIVKVKKKSNKITITALKKGKAKITVTSKKVKGKKYKLTVVVNKKTTLKKKGTTNKNSKDNKLNQLLEKYGSLDAPEIQQMIQADIEKARKTGEVIYGDSTEWSDYMITPAGAISISKDNKYTIGQMKGVYEDYWENQNTLRNGQVVYNLSNIRIPLNIPKGYMVYLNIKGHIDNSSYINTEEYWNYFNEPKVWEYPTKDKYDLCLTDKDKYINNIAYYCEAKEGCNDNPDADFPLGVGVYRYTLCAKVYDTTGNLVSITWDRD